MHCVDLHIRGEWSFISSSEFSGDILGVVIDFLDS